MNPVTWINVLTLIFAVGFLYYLFRLYFQYNIQKNTFSRYLDEAVSLSRLEREKVASQLNEEENAFKTSRRLFLIFSLLFILGLVIIILFMRNIAEFKYVILATIALVFLSIVIYKTMRERRNTKMINQLPNVIDLIIHYSLGHMSLIEIMPLVSRQVHKPLAQFFEEVTRRLHGGQSLSAALEKSARPYKIFQLDYFVMVLLLQQETGADTISVLRRFEVLLRREAILQQKIKAIKADFVAIQWGVVLAVIFMFLYRYHIDPASVHAMLASSIGFKLFMLAIFIAIVGIFLMRRILRVT